MKADQSIPLLADCHKQSQISPNIVTSSARVDTPQVPFQTLSQNSGSHLSHLSAPLFTEDRYSTSTDNDQENCDAEVSKITRWQTPSQATTIVMSPKRPVSTPSAVDYSTQGDPDQIALQGNITKTILTQQFKIPIIISFQMKVIDTSMTYKTKFST